MEMRVYVACLASYNEGTLYGEWLDLADYSSKDEIMTAIGEMLAKSPTAGAEEWAVFDYDGVPAAFAGTEYPDFDGLIRLQEIAADHDEDVIEAAGEISSGIEELESTLEGFAGCYDSEDDFGAEQWEEMGLIDQIPEALRYYIDYEAWTRDCRLNGALAIVDNRYYFWVNR